MPSFQVRPWGRPASLRCPAPSASPPARCRRTGGRSPARSALTSPCGSHRRCGSPCCPARGGRRARRPAAPVAGRNRAPAPPGRRCRPAVRRRRPRCAGRRPRCVRAARRRGRPRPRAGWPGRPGPATSRRRRSRTRSGPAAPSPWRRRGADERHRPPVEQERGRQQREHPAPAVPVLEGDRVALLARLHRLPDSDDGAAEPAVRRLDDQARVSGHLGHGSPPPTTGEEVADVIRHARRR